MSETDPSASSDAAVEARWGETEFVEELGDSFWMHPAGVRAHLNRLATGSPLCDWLTWFKAHWAPPRADGGTQRCLVLGCGDGWLERALVADRPDLRVDASDVAAGAVERARRTAAELGLDAIEYSVLNLDRETLPAGRYDLVVAHSVLHHVAELEHAFDQIESCLRPGGLMVVNEFVGPCHLQYTDEALETIDALLSALPERYRISPTTGEVLTSKPRPDLGYLLQVDPSEGVRADELDGFLRSRFDLLYEADMGGTVLQHLLWQIAHNFRDDDPFDQVVVGTLCAVEECLVAEGALASDYRLYVVGRRGDTERKALPSAHRLDDPLPPRSVHAESASDTAWRELPVAREHLHTVATGLPECDGATLALDRLSALGVGREEPVLIYGESWLAPTVRERFPRAVTVSSPRSLLWTFPRRFAAIVWLEALASSPESAHRLVRRLRRRLRPGGVLLASERLQPTPRNRRQLARLVRGAVPIATGPIETAAMETAETGPDDPFVLGPERSSLPRDLEALLEPMGRIVETLPTGGELLEPMLDGGGWRERGFSDEQIEELVGLLVVAERLLRRFSVLDDEGVVALARAQTAPAR